MEKNLTLSEKLDIIGRLPYGSYPDATYLLIEVGVYEKWRGGAIGSLAWQNFERRADEILQKEQDKKDRQHEIKVDQTKLAIRHSYLKNFINNSCYEKERE